MTKVPVGSVDGSSSGKPHTGSDAQRTQVIGEANAGGDLYTRIAKTTRKFWGMAGAAGAAFTLGATLLIYSATWSLLHPNGSPNSIVWGVFATGVVLVIGALAFSGVIAFNYKRRFEALLAENKNLIQTTERVASNALKVNAEVRTLLLMNVSTVESLLEAAGPVLYFLNAEDLVKQRNLNATVVDGAKEIERVLKDLNLAIEKMDPGRIQPYANRMARLVEDMEKSIRDGTPQLKAIGQTAKTRLDDVRVCAVRYCDALDDTARRAQLVLSAVEALRAFDKVLPETVKATLGSLGFLREQIQLAVTVADCIRDAAKSGSSQHIQAALEAANSFSNAVKSNAQSWLAQPSNLGKQ